MVEHMRYEVDYYEFFKHLSRHANVARGKSNHHLVDQPGPADAGGTRFTPKRQKAWVAKGGKLWTPQQAMEHLESAKKTGTIACDWGCTQKVQSRGCAMHAPARWSI